jgi:excisionase family DNA binding protein
MARQSKIDQIIRLTQSGWRAYEGQATAAVFDNLNCEKPWRGRARWFARGNLLICVGCDRACTLSCPEGFQLPLFTYPAAPAQPAFRLAPDELLAKRKLLTPNEAAYVLNVSSRQVRKMIHEGRLRVTKLAPLRVPVAEIKAMLADVGLWTPESEERLDDKARNLG